MSRWELLPPLWIRPKAGLLTNHGYGVRGKEGMRPGDYQSYTYAASDSTIQYMWASTPSMCSPLSTCQRVIRHESPGSCVLRHMIDAPRASPRILVCLSGGIALGLKPFMFESVHRGRRGRRTTPRIWFLGYRNSGQTMSGNTSGFPGGGCSKGYATMNNDPHRVSR